MQVGDGLPDLMCVPCVLQVSRAFTFKQQCQRSDQTLKSYLESQLCSLNQADNNDIQNTFKSDGSNDVDHVINEHEIEENDVANRTNEHHFSSTDDTATDQLDGEQVLDSLPPEIGSDSFEEEIGLDNLPSPVASEDIEQHLDADVLNDELDEEDTEINRDSSRFGNYFDDLKLHVGHVVSLTDNELPDQSIEGTFGESSFLTNIFSKIN